MNIERHLSKNGAIVICENGEALCSTYDPLEEAAAWVQRANLKNIEQVVVLGLGSGHHIDELLKQNPQIKITVIDVRSELFDIFEQNYPLTADRIKLFNLHEGTEFDDRIYNFLEKFQPTILCFKPAWKNHEKYFSDLFASFTFRNLKMIERSFKEEMENDVFDFSKLGSERNLIHLKNIHESLKDFSDDTALKISVLRELWI